MLNILLNLNNTVGLNQIITMTISSFLNITIKMYLRIYKEKNWLNLVMLIDMYKGSEANNIFH